MCACLPACLHVPVRVTGGCVVGVSLISGVYYIYFYMCISYSVCVSVCSCVCWCLGVCLSVCVYRVTHRPYAVWPSVLMGNGSHLQVMTVR